MKSKAIIKTKLEEDGTLTNSFKTKGDINFVINGLLDTLYSVCLENEVDLKEVCKVLKDYDKNIILGEKQC